MVAKSRTDHENARFTEESQVRVRIEGDVPRGDAEVDEFSVLSEHLADLTLQLKILNKYMSEGFDMEITEEDI